MQSSESILYNLAKNSTKKDYLYERLYRNLYNPNLYYHVFENLKKKSPDLKNRELDEEKINYLIKLLKTEQYQPPRIKPNGKIDETDLLKLEKLPRLYHRVLLETIVLLLETIFLPSLPEHVYGFSNYQSPHLAVKDVEERYRFVDFFISCDLTPHFNELSREHLERGLRKKIADERFIRLINKYVRAGYFNDFLYGRTYSGTVLAGRLSSIFSQISLLELDEKLQSYTSAYYLQVDSKVNPDYLDLENQLKNRSPQTEDKHTLESRLIRTPYYIYDLSPQGVLYTRYSSAFLIGVRGKKAFVDKIQKDLNKIINDFFSIELDETELKRTTAKKGSIFLGYHFRIKRQPPSRKHMKAYNEPYVDLKIPHGRIERMILDKKMVVDIDAKKWKPIHRGSLLNLDDLEIMEIYDSELKSFYDYYSLAQNVSNKMGQLHYVMEYSCLKTFANKYRTTLLKFKKAHMFGHDWGIAYDTKQGKQVKKIYKGFKRKFKPIKNIKVDRIETNNRIWKKYRKKHS